MCIESEYPIYIKTRSYKKIKKTFCFFIKSLYSRDCGTYVYLSCSELTFKIF